MQDAQLIDLANYLTFSAFEPREDVVSSTLVLCSYYQTAGRILGEIALRVHNQLPCRVWFRHPISNLDDRTQKDLSYQVRSGYINTPTDEIDFESHECWCFEDLSTLQAVDSEVRERHRGPVVVLAWPLNLSRDDLDWLFELYPLTRLLKLVYSSLEETLTSSMMVHSAVMGITQAAAFVSGQRLDEAEGYRHFEISQQYCNTVAKAFNPEVHETVEMTLDRYMGSSRLSRPSEHQVTALFREAPKLQLFFEVYSAHLELKHVVYTRYRFDAGAELLYQVALRLGYENVYLPDASSEHFETELESFNSSRTGLLILSYSSLPRIKQLSNVRHLHLFDGEFELSYRTLIRASGSEHVQAIHPVEITTHNYTMTSASIQTADLVLYREWVEMRNRAVQYWNSLEQQADQIEIGSDWTSTSPVRFRTSNE